MKGKQPVKLLLRGEEESFLKKRAVKGGDKEGKH